MFCLILHVSSYRYNYACIIWIFCLFYWSKFTKLMLTWIYRHACTTSSLWKRLLETLQHLLCPMLHDVNADKLQNGRFGWTVIKHNFGGDENHVLTHVLCPSIEEHQNEICCSLKDERLNELLLLEKLNHPHIVQLQAFNNSCWPQFYITEDYLTCALQTTLVNKSRNGHFFSLTE